MQIQVYHAKIQNLRMTGKNIDYEGSITLGQDLLEASGLIPNEKVQVLNKNSGLRFETYIIKGKEGEVILNGPAARKLRHRDFSDDRSRDRHPLMMVIATRVMMPIALMVGVYIFLRGHNQPGGGFVAGLVVSIALLMQYMASGFGWTQRRQRIEYHSLIGWGVLVAGLTGAAAWFYSAPFLTSLYGYIDLPPIERFGIGTAFLFDLGVFLAVLGAVMLMLNSLSRIARYAGETVNREPMDYDPSTRVRAAKEEQ